jgi:predicted nucleotidyltransferase
MIHKKYFVILEQFLGDYKAEIHGRSLIGKIPLSQKGIALTLHELEKKGILQSKQKGSMKLFILNTKFPQLKDILLMVELQRKIDFLNKHTILLEIFQEDERIIGIFGSYAKNTQKSDSDIDIFIIGEKNKEEYIQKKAKMFDLNISSINYSKTQFKNLLQTKNNLVKEIVNNHVLINQPFPFIYDLWRFYYEFP